ncbi:ATP-binding protein [Vibrio vulnificus]|uniref:ATP-binding protein n=1 Tax=Vibrio vulnificus TaxID=672 RepID=UPI00051D3133|nr:ATP-binding protein [Vibrio vulnificus]KGK68558.1 hypothetical protein NA76_20525 [Vibrio vulnificus]
MAKIKPRARLIRTIGDKLISGPEAAIIELVKNSYDAESSSVNKKISPPQKFPLFGGEIVISDTGHGMTEHDLINNWLEPATDTNDTDRDTIPDYVEAQLCIDANQSDTDQDGLSDRQELEQLNSACNPDVDGDGMLDGFEMLEGSNLHVGDGDKDSNGDGITNWYSFAHWYQQQNLSHGEQVTALPNGTLNLMGQADSRVITGFYPDATDKTLMFDINYHQLKGLNQRLGADDT